MPYEKLDNEDIQDAIGLARQLNAVPPEMRGQFVSAAPTSISEDIGNFAGQTLAAAPDWMKGGADPNKFAEAVTFGAQMLPPLAVEQAMTDTERGNYGSAVLNAAGAVPGGKLAAPLVTKAMALIPKKVGSGLAALADDAVRLSKEEFLAKHSAEVTPEKLERGDLPAQRVHDYVEPGNVDPSEYNMWGDTDLTTGKSGEKVRGMMDTLAAGKEMPPVILRGTPDDPGYRPMVMEGHHRTMAHILKGEPLPVIYDDKTLGELWDRANLSSVSEIVSGIRSAKEINDKSDLFKFIQGSKIIDRSGDPLRLYHITNRDLSVLIPGGHDPELSGMATWLSPYADRQPAAHNAGGLRGFKEGANVIPVYASIKNPLVVDTPELVKSVRGDYPQNKNFPYILTQEARDAMIRDGYDGAIWAGDESNPYDIGKLIIGEQPSKEEEILSFFPERQLKSAIGNIGTYDPNIPDITKAGGGRIHKEGGGIAIGQDQVADAIRLAKDTNARNAEQAQATQFLSQNPEMVNQLRVNSGQEPLPVVTTPREPNIVERAYDFVMGRGTDRQPLPAMDVPAFQRPVYDQPVAISTARGPIYQTPRQADAARINNDFWRNRSAIGQLVSGTLQSGQQAFTLPGRAAMGEVPQDQMIPEALNFAGFVTGGAGFVPMEANSLRAGAGFYSKAKYVAENLPAEVMEKQQALGMLRNAGVSPDELKWTNLDVRLSEPGKITKPELVKLIEDQDIKLKNIVQSDKFVDKLADIEPSPEIYAQFKTQIQDADDALERAQKRIEDLEVRYQAGEFEDNLKSYLDKKRVFHRDLEEKYQDQNSLIQRMQVAEAEKQGLYGGAPQFEDWSLKGGQDYRENLMQVERPKYGAFDLETDEDLLGGKRFWTANDAMAAAKATGTNRDYSARILDNEWPYVGPHFKQEDIVAHTRGQTFDVVNPVTGKKTRVWNVDESQSDYGQQARKHGVEEYKGQIPVQYINNVAKAANEIVDLENQLIQLSIDFQNGKMDILEYRRDQKVLEIERDKSKYDLQYQFKVSGRRLDELVYLASKKDEIDPEMFNEGMTEILEGSKTRAVSPGPYIGSTDKWTALNVRRSIIDAYENNADWLTFTPGEVQAERYNMRNFVKNIDYIKRGNRYEITAFKKDGSPIQFPKKLFSSDDLDETFGKDVADQIRNQEGRALTYEKGTVRTLTPEDFKIGGEGHIKYYRNIYAKEVKKAFKELGVKVELETKTVPTINKFRQKVDLPLIGVRMTPEVRAALEARKQKYGGYFQQMANGGKVMPHVEAALRIAARYGDD